VSSLAFKAFRCEDLDDGLEERSGVKMSVMTADFGVQCYDPDPVWDEASGTSEFKYTEEYQSVRNLAVVGILAYPVMMPFLYFGMFWRVRRALLNNQPTEFSQALRFMTEEFNPRFFYWSLVEMIKKLVLMGAMSLVYPGTIKQLVVAFVLMICFMVALIVIKPYKRVGDDALALAANFGLVMFFFFSLILKFQDLIEQMDGSLTNRLRDEFEFDTSTNAGLLIATSLGTTVFAGLVTLLGVVHDRRREAESFKPLHLKATGNI